MVSTRGPMACNPNRRVRHARGVCDHLCSLGFRIKGSGPSVWNAGMGAQGLELSNGFS